MIKGAKIFKVAIVGDGGVGKTTLTKVFCDNPYVDQIMTIGIDVHVKTAVVNGYPQTLKAIESPTPFFLAMKRPAIAIHGNILREKPRYIKK